MSSSTFFDVQDEHYLLFNYLLLIFKYNIYNSRVNNNLHFQSLKCVIPGIQCIEEAMNNDHINKNMIINNDYLFSAIFSLFTAKATGRERGFTIVFFISIFF